MHIEQFAEILAGFQLESAVTDVQPLGSGHIHQTFRVVTSSENRPGYVLQRINSTIFPDVEALMGNIVRVTEHLRGRISAATGRYGSFTAPRVVPAASGAYWIRDSRGACWRLYERVAGVSHDTVSGPDAAFKGGKAFGLFQLLASDFDASGLVEILPAFHDIRPRLAAFRGKVKADPAGRVAEATAEILFVEQRAEQMHAIILLGEAGELPLRVTHNDTKFNNILFDASGEAVAVVDLDTVMPGYSLYDFGDAIRTGASTAAEDTADLASMNIDLDLFRAYAGGYLSVAGAFLTKAEIDRLAFSARFMTYIIGLRFLTDHVDGDHYFRTAFPGHNLQRARAQFRLLSEMERQSDEMERIIRSID